MKGAQVHLARRWPLLTAATVVLALTTAGLVLLLWAQAEHNRAALAREADLRGTAVSTLATDVRALRVQVQQAGRTPVAPDPARAVAHLPERAAVPVPIPGPRGMPGVSGSPGASGQPGRVGATGSPGVPGATGVPGIAGVQGAKGDQGEQGLPGRDGVDGKDGRDGAPGPACPAGYSLQVPPWDPDALVCRRDGGTEPGPTPTVSPTGALDPRRRT